jgi:SAM-dependent methyltransferase
MKITLQDLALAFGTARDFEESTKSVFRSHNFSFVEPDQSEQDQIRVEIEQRITDGFSQVGSHRAEIWESAWNEVKEKFVNSNFDPLALNPNFISNYDYVRWNGRYIRPNDRRMELSFFEVFRDWLFAEYLVNTKNVYEFGSGSGFNIVELSQKYPEKNLVGFDWSGSAIDILNLYAQSTGANVKGFRFDFFNPDLSVEVPDNTVFLTFCALEQIGPKFQPMLDFFISKRPALIIQMEPTLEFYDIKNPFDQIAIRYHQHRHYLQGYYTKLRELASASRIELFCSKRLNFGSKYNECYSFHIWKPV